MNNFFGNGVRAVSDHRVCGEGAFVVDLERKRGLRKFVIPTPVLAVTIV